MSISWNMMTVMNWLRWKDWTITGVDHTHSVSEAYIWQSHICSSNPDNWRCACILAHTISDSITQQRGPLWVGGILDCGWWCAGAGFVVKSHAYIMGSPMNGSHLSLSACWPIYLIQTLFDSVSVPDIKDAAKLGSFRKQWGHLHRQKGSSNPKCSEGRALWGEWPNKLSNKSNFMLWKMKAATKCHY